jgi:hypothetical protein
VVPELGRWNSAAIRFHACLQVVMDGVAGLRRLTKRRKEPELARPNVRRSRCEVGVAGGLPVTVFYAVPRSDYLEVTVIVAAIVELLR